MKKLSNVNCALGICGVVAAVIMIVAGCATKMTEMSTAAEYCQRGYTRSDRNPDMLILPSPTAAEQKQAGIVIGTPLVLSINDAAWTSHPIKMALSWAWDYVALPVAGTGLAAYGVSRAWSSGGGGSNSSKACRVCANR